MECKKVVENLYDYSKGETGPRLKEEISSHLAGCPACSAEYEGLARLKSAIGSSLEEPPAAVLEAIRSKMAAASLSAGRTGPGRFLKPALAMAAGMLITAAAGLYTARELGDRSDMARYMLENYEVVEHAYYDNTAIEDEPEIIYEGII